VAEQQAAEVSSTCPLKVANHYCIHECQLSVDKDGRIGLIMNAEGCHIHIEKGVDYIPCIQIIHHIYTISYYTYFNCWS
jgi:hypothetical protein